ncbi:MAG TPA: hypothetical protein VHW09_16080 [Bryobacteraceae bacterium]|jgi:hypothetical protein|nr:hypothetical protein [Bryobacteraceae bacterium]
MIRWLVFALLTPLHLAGAQELPPVSGLPHPVALRRIPVDAAWDLVAALSSSQPCLPAPLPCWWNTKDRLAILLQNRDGPREVVPLAIEPGPNDDCSTRIERFTPQELVLSCVGEKWATYDNQKFVYDVGARKLTGHFAYPSFSAARVLPEPEFVMAGGGQQLLAAIDPGTGDPRIVQGEIPKARPTSSLDIAKLPPLPQTDLQTWERARPNQVGSYSDVSLAEIHEEIGPHQTDGALLWFGKTFYDAEGATGVGGFGYFDPATASYHLYAPREMTAWSVSAILVEPDCIWLALYARSEYGNYPGGLLRWDRNTQSIRRWEMPWIATGIGRGHDGIYLGTTNGIAAVRGDGLISWFVDRSDDGQYRMAARN